MSRFVVALVAVGLVAMSVSAQSPNRNQSQNQVVVRPIIKPVVVVNNNLQQQTQQSLLYYQQNAPQFNRTGPVVMPQYSPAPYYPQMPYYPSYRYPY